MLVGIDPGSHGAIAWLSDDGHLIYVDDMPTVQVKVGKTMRTRMLPAALAMMFRNKRPAHVFLEEVQPMPGNGGISAFGLGKSAGIIEGVVVALGIGLTLVKPKEWQKHFNQRGDKGASRATACRLWPGCAERFARVKDDGRAEAALIGLYGSARTNGLAGQRGRE